MSLSPIRFTVEKIGWMLEEFPDGWTESYRDELQRCLASLKERLELLSQGTATFGPGNEAWQEGHDLVKLQGRIILRLKQVHRLITGEWRALSL